GRVAMARRDARGALAAFDKMGTRRPVARWLFTLRAALGAGDQERSFAAAEALLAAIARGRDPDALRIARSRIYDRELRQLLKLSRDPRRMLALLRKLEPHPGGEIRRLVLLLSVQQALRMNEAAAKTLDRIREFRLLDERLPKLCEPIYKAAGRPAEGKRCLAELGKFFPKPLGEPLWKAR
ncbi:MAG: hypothetical protein KC503_05725, partial [Myxococcales bacterium]|nr:hypothetical protein [Myxococcales bacterium]